MSQEKEIGGSAAPLGGHSLTLGPPQGKGRKKDRHRGARHGAAHGNGADDATVRAGFAEICAAHPRPWVDDADDDLRAYKQALQLTDHVTLLAFIKANAKAADNPRFLKSLAQLFDRRAWEKPLPSRQANGSGARRHNGAHRRRGNSGKSAEEIVKERILKRQGVTS